MRHQSSSGSTLVDAVIHDENKIRGWDRASEKDIQKSLGGDHPVFNCDQTGRGEYFIYGVDETEREFVKVLIKDYEDDNVLRRATGENLARMVSIPSVDCLFPLTCKRIVESLGFPGDFYVVSHFKKGTEALTPTHPALGKSLVESLGRFVYNIESVTTPSPIAPRKALDAIELLHYLASRSGMSNLPRLSRGCSEVLSIIQSEADLISRLVNEVRSLSSSVRFSHGDLKVSQLLRDQSGSIFVCDWEECGFALPLNDLSFVAADMFYSQIRGFVDQRLDSTSDATDLGELYEEAVGVASAIVLDLVYGYVDSRGVELTAGEQRVFEIRLGLAGLLRLYTVSAKSNFARPRELALASLGVQLAEGHGWKIF